MGQVLGTMLGVVGDHQRAGAQAAFQQGEDLRVERLGAVQQDQVDAVRQVLGEGLQGVALAQFHQVEQPPSGQVAPCPLGLGGFELAADQAATAVVPQRRGEVQGGQAEGRAELDDAARRAAARQHVEQAAGFAGDGQRQVLQAAVELAVFGLAAHEALQLGLREVGEGGTVARCAGFGFGEQALQEIGERGVGEGIHGWLRECLSA